MRHRLKGRKLRRTTAHRQAMTRNLVTSLFVHGRVLTTLEKAKEMRGPAERLVTLGKEVAKAGRSTVEAKRQGLAPFRAIMSVVQDVKVARKICTDVVGRFADRTGGYTRIVKLGGCRWDGDGRGLYAWNRLGDNGRRAIFELVVAKSPEEELQLAGRAAKPAAAAEGKAKAPAKGAAAKDAKPKPAAK